MSLVLTRIQNIRANSNLDKYELRASRYGAIDTFIAQSNDTAGILTPELKEKARLSIGNILETPVIDYDADIQIGNTRELTIPDSENTSRMVQINFATYSWGFTITPAMYMNNEIGLQRDFERKFMKYLYKFAKKLDEAALSKLAADKTTVLNNHLLYNWANSCVTAKHSERENLFGDLDVMINSNDFFGQLHVIGDAGVESIMKKLQQHGFYNAVNKQNEFGNKVVHFTNSMATVANRLANGFAVNSGSLGILTRFERDCLLGTVSRDGHEWGIAQLPILGIPVGTYFYDSVGNYSDIAGAATADMVRTRKEHYGFAVDIALLSAYNSDRNTIPSPILKFDVASTDVI